MTMRAYVWWLHGESRWLTQVWTMKSVTAMLKNYMVAGAYDWCVHLNKIFDYIYLEKIFQLKKYQASILELVKIYERIELKLFND